MCRRSLLRPISAHFPQLSPKSLHLRFQVRAMGCQWEKGVIRNMKTCPCAHCLRAAASKVGGWVENPIPLWRRHSVIPEGEEENTHTPGEVSTKSSPPTAASLETYLWFFFLDIKGNWGTDHASSCSAGTRQAVVVIMRKGENGTKYSFPSNEHCGGNLSGFGEIKLEKT